MWSSSRRPLRSASPRPKRRLAALVAPTRRRLPKDLLRAPVAVYRLPEEVGVCALAGAERADFA